MHSLAAIAAVLVAAMVAFGILGAVTSYQLHNHLQAAYREKHRHVREGGDLSVGFKHLLRFHRYVWSHEDDDDHQVKKLRGRVRLAMVGGLVSGILALAVPVGGPLLVEHFRP